VKIAAYGGAMTLKGQRLMSLDATPGGHVRKRLPALMPRIFPRAKRST
jgi:hypothetical protein